MDSFYFSLDHSAWWLLVIVPVAGVLSWFLYSGKSVLSIKQRWLLGSLRFLAVFLILFLLLNPSFNTVRSVREKPVFPVLIDNSRSVTLAGAKPEDVKAGLNEIKALLDKKGFEPRFISFNRTVLSTDSILFDSESSDITGLLRKGDDNTAGIRDRKMILVSDGIFNSGSSPLYNHYKSDIYSLGLGDTVPRKDQMLKSLQNNAVAFLGNKFTIRADVQLTGFPGRTAEVLLRNQAGVLERRTVTAKGDFFSEKIDFTVLAATKGFQKYTVEILKTGGESNEFNNVLHAYVDIIDDRENVLIVAASPHPLIKALKAALSKEENIHTEVIIPGISSAKNQQYDLVILVNCLKNSVAEAKPLIRDNTPLLYIVGSSSNFAGFNAENGLVEVPGGKQTDQVQATINAQFSRFKPDPESEGVLAFLPPVEVTFGEVRLKGGSDILLYQKINGIETRKPLLIFGQTNRKTGVLLTDGWWLMRMYEGQNKEVPSVTDGIIVKTVQFLSAKEDKRKFRIYPHQREYVEGETVLIETELYNDLYERVFEENIDFELKGDAGKAVRYKLETSEGNTALALNSLPPGVYRISASVVHNGQKLSSATEFLVRERQLEALNLKADHQLLRQLSSENGGQFFTWQQKQSLFENLDKLEAKAIWRSTEKKNELIDEVWYFVLIIVVLSAEWFIRRHLGSY